MERKQGLHGGGKGTLEERGESVLPSEETCMMLAASGKGGLPLGSRRCPSDCITMLLAWHSGEEAMLHDGHDVGTKPCGRGKNTGVKHPQRLPRGCTFEQIGQRAQSTQTPSHRHLQERVRKSTGGSEARKRILGTGQEISLITGLDPTGGRSTQPRRGWRGVR